MIGTPREVIDLRSGLPLESYNGIITKSVNTPFDASATCPVWEDFLLDIFSNDTELVKYIQKAVGYSLTGDISEHCYFFLQGRGSNGKSTFLETIVRMMGSYYHRAPQSLYSKSRNGVQSPNDLAHLKGARFVVCGETERGVSLAESQIKDITGGESVTGCLKYKEPFVFRPECKLWFAGNHAPKVAGSDDGIWRRTHLIPFERQFIGKDKRPELPLLLVSELTGIFQWALKGCQLYQDEGLSAPKAVCQAVSDYRRGEDILADFLEEYIIKEPDYTVSKKDLFDTYKKWCRSYGIDHPLTLRGLGMALKERGWRDKRTQKERVWTGIKLNPLAIQSRSRSRDSLFVGN